LGAVDIIFLKAPDKSGSYNTMTAHTPTRNTRINNNR
jgi:hypothetical protein